MLFRVLIEVLVAMRAHSCEIDARVLWWECCLWRSSGSAVRGAGVQSACFFGIWSLCWCNVCILSVGKFGARPPMSLPNGP